MTALTGPGGAGAALVLAREIALALVVALLLLLLVMMTTLAAVLITRALLVLLLIAWILRVAMGFARGVVVATTAAALVGLTWAVVLTLSLLMLMLWPPVVIARGRLITRIPRISWVTHRRPLVRALLALIAAGAAFLITRAGVTRAA